MTVTIDRLDGAVRVVLDRPPLNTLDHEMILSLEQAFRDHAGAAALIVRGARRAFSAGVDTTAFTGYSAAQKAEMIMAITRMTATLLAIRGPVVAEVNGHALGGGLVIPLCADYRIAVDEADAKFGLTEARAGVPFPAGPVEIIAHELPPALLRQLTLSGRVVGARALFEHAVFDELVPAAELADRAVAVARDLAAQPAFAIVKEQVRGGLRKRVAALAAGQDPLLGHFGLPQPAKT